MGEFLTLPPEHRWHDTEHGVVIDQIKLATGNTWDTLRYDEAKILAEALPDAYPWSELDRQDGAWAPLFRFPYPDEDGLTDVAEILRAVEDRVPRKDIFKVPVSYARDLAHQMVSVHDLEWTVRFGVQAKIAGNLIFTCPVVLPSAATMIETRPTPARGAWIASLSFNMSGPIVPLFVDSHAQRGGRFHPVIGCGYCGSLQRVDVNELLLERIDIDAALRQRLLAHI